jgi:hypothetical protein
LDAKGRRSYEYVELFLRVARVAKQESQNCVSLLLLLLLLLFARNAMEWKFTRTFQYQKIRRHERDVFLFIRTETGLSFFFVVSEHGAPR